MLGIKDRFLDKVDLIPFHTCWEWSASRNAQGYGFFWASGTMRRANRVAWEIFVGPIPIGQWVLHRCDNPGCVNPHHLFLGNRSDNMLDMHAKGRGFIKKHPSDEARATAKNLAKRKYLLKKRGLWQEM